MNISHIYSEVPPDVSKSTIEIIAKAVARDILESVRWYDIDLDDIWRDDSIKYIRTVIKRNYNIK